MVTIDAKAAYPDGQSAEKVIKSAIESGKGEQV